jgi:fructose-1,6-bisphosphatase/inositol monophosphatase family enzyme
MSDGRRDVTDQPRVADLLGPIRRIHERVRDAVVLASEQSDVDQLAGISDDESPGDTIYAVDRISEDLLVQFFAEELAQSAPLVLVAEGIEDGELVLPVGATERDAVWRVIVDPIDGTRGLMYQKRSAWVLTGVAPNRGPETNLQDIELSVQTEIPLVKQHLADVLWAIQGQGAHAERFNRLTQESKPLALKPSRATTIRHGFAMVARFFPGARDELAAIDEEIVRSVLGPVEHGKAHCFEDQYLSSGGQLYELMMGHDRFVADLRPLTEKVLNRAGFELGICCHPYDLCTELIAREAGVIVTDERGGPLRAPLNVEADIAWAGYANESIQSEIEPVLHRVLSERGLQRE